MITEDYVSFEVAKLLKDKGFNEACNRVYEGPNLIYTDIPISPLMYLGELKGELGGFHPKQKYIHNNELGDIVYTAPTFQMARKWLREKYNIHIEVVHLNPYKHTYYLYRYYSCQSERYVQNTNPEYSTYEKACEAAIKYCLENLI